MERPLLCFILRLARNQELALEILQDVWLQCGKRISALREPRSVRAWLYRLAHGLAVDQIRRERHRIEVEQEHLSVGEDLNSAEPLDGFEPVDIQRALDRLEPDQRDALTLHFLEDFSISEIGEIVGAAEGTVKSRIHYAKKALKKELLKGRTNV
jgi:RNA polymerase sigma-70 factor (ECF subfamily)